MGWFRHSQFMSAVFTALILFAAIPVTAGPPVRNPAASSATYIKVAGVNYVDARVFFARQGFKVAWVERGQTMRLQGATPASILPPTNATWCSTAFACSWASRRCFAETHST